MAAFELNADLGEGCPYDRQIMPHITQANIACAAHAGNAQTMEESVLLAQEFGVKIGAHPGYADPENFGRVDLGLAPVDVYRLVRDQVEKLAEVCVRHRADLCHVKPHGALYNRAARDLECADAIARAVRDVNPSLVLMGLAGSLLIDAGKQNGLETCGEFFADRNYNADGSLVPRTQEHACIHDVNEAAERVRLFVSEGFVYSLDHKKLEIDASTICLHGDSPQAIAFAKAISDALKR